MSGRKKKQKAPIRKKAYGTGVAIEKEKKKRTYSDIHQVIFMFTSELPIHHHENLNETIFKTVVRSLITL